MPKNIAGGAGSAAGGDGIFPNILVNVFAARINSAANSFLVYNNTSTNPIFKINGQANTATFYCDLNVIGNASFTTVSNVAVTASMMSLATSNSVADLIDIGFYGVYNSSGVKYRGLIRSISAGRWVLFKDINVAPSSTVPLSGVYQDDLEVNNLYFGGSGDTISALRTDVDGFPDALKNLTTAEINQLTNINLNAISSAQWGYLAASNQSTATSDAPSFAGLTLTASVTQSAGTFRFTTGAVDTPAVYFNTDTTTGLYRVAANQLGVTVSGANVSTWSSTGLTLTGHVLTSTNNAYDIGASGTAFANVYVTNLRSTNLYGTLQTAAQTNVTSVGTLTALTMGGHVLASMNNTFNVGASGTAFANVYATNLYGTLQTGAQTNITSVGTLSELAVSSTGGAAVTIGGFQASLSNSRINGMRIDGIAFYSGALGNADGIFMNYGFYTPQNTNSISAGSGIRIYNNVSGITGTLGTAYGLYVQNGTSLGGGTCTMSYGAYIAQQSVGTTKCALYSENLSVGYTDTSPPSSGAIINGTLAIGTSSSGTYGSYLLYCNGTSYFAGNMTLASTNISGVGTLSATTLAGALSTAAQTAITSVGTLTALTVGGNITQSSGVTTLPAGLVGTPSLYLGADSTTGFYRPGANQMGIAVSGVNVGTWSSTGLALNSLAISGVSTLTATTLGGTLSTASQPNVTTMVAISTLGATGTALSIPSTSITISGVAVSATQFGYLGAFNQGLATTSSPTFNVLTATTLAGTLSTGTQTNITSVGTLSGLAVSSTGGAAVIISGLQTSLSNSRINGMRIDGVAYYFGALGNADGIFMNYGFYTPQNTNSISAGSGIRIYNNVSGIIGTLGTAYGLFVQSGTSLGSGTCTMSYGAYIAQQSVGTTKCALYSDNLSVGYTDTAPPSSGAIISGTLAIGTSSSGTYGANKLYVSGTTYLNGGVALNNNNLSGVATLTATTLGGTLSTGAQPNITSLASLTSIQGVSVSSGAWTYVNSMNQSVASTSTPTFGRVTIFKSSSGELLTALSSSTAYNCSLSFGRAAVEVDIGIAAGPDQYCEGTYAGDVCFRTNNSAKNILFSNGLGQYTMKVTSGGTTIRGNYSTLRLESNLAGGYNQIQMFPNNQIANGWTLYTSGSSTPTITLQSSTNYLYVGWNGTSWVGVSDQRVKKNFEVFNSQALPLINALCLKKYNMIDEKDGEPKTLGLVAQDVQAIIPDVVSSNINKEGEERLGIDYTGITKYLIKAIQELTVRLQAAESKLA